MGQPGLLVRSRQAATTYDESVPPDGTEKRAPFRLKILSEALCACVKTCQCFCNHNPVLTQGTQASQDDQRHDLHGTARQYGHRFP